MNFKIFTTVLLVMAMGFTGCKKFLQVNPKDSVSEKQLFSSEVGFDQSLTGVYSVLADRTLYGDNLTMGFASALAQNYQSTGATTFKFAETIRYNYTTQEIDNYVSDIWMSSYNAIGQLNNIIAQIDNKKSLFSGNNYERIKGEAYGLRAFLHFDLMRLFVPVYPGNETKKAIPYRTALSINSSVPVTMKEVVDNVLADLKISQDYLKNIDQAQPNNLARRFYMNYLATKALEARISLYIGDKLRATAAAQEVVNTVGTKLNFITEAEISATYNRDRLFSKEQIFSLRVRNIKTWVETNEGYFKAIATSANMLRRNDADISTLYESSSTDYRFRFQFEIDGSLKFLSKYWQTWVGSEASRLDQTVPLIRLSEMYYILAETAPTAAEGVTFLNTIRSKRALLPLAANVTAAKLASEISKEYQKEFYGEGQTFFYLKRTNATAIPFYVDQYGSPLSFSDKIYTLPLPLKENEFNPNYTN